MSIYEHSPLLKGQAHIRLMKLVPGQATDNIECTFSIFDIDAAPKYQALSYEWGAKFRFELIRINDRITSIRRNLWKFLSRLKSHGYHGYLWCDAICIDQNNYHERNHQVQLMSQIYRKAHSVLVWLGEESRDSSSTFRILRIISTCQDAVSRASHLTRRAEIWKALAHLTKRRYWTRIWIVQEVTVAKTAVLFCGDEHLPWQVFATACKFPPDQLTPWASDLWAPLPGGQPEQQIERRAAGRELYRSIMYGLLRSQRRWPIYADSFTDLLIRYEYSGCEDDRDRIFALLNIAKEVALDRSITVDYRKDMEEIFFSLVAWEGTGSIAIHSRLEFARSVASALGFLSQWADYPLESTIQSVCQRSPSFHRWLRQKLPISLGCRPLGRWEFHKDQDTGTGRARISPTLFKSEPVDVYAPLDTVSHFKDPSFDLFGFATSQVLLACKANSDNTWTVLVRAFYHSPGSLAVPSVFEGVKVHIDASDRYSVEVETAAQFMEIFLDDVGPRWRGEQNIGPKIKGGGSLAKARNNEDRNLKEVLQALKITSPLRLREQGEAEESAQESDEEDSFEGDQERLKAESEALAKPRTSGVPTEQPRRSRGTTSWSGDSNPNSFWDCFCERTSAAEDLGDSVVSPTLLFAGTPSVTPRSMDFAPTSAMPYSLAPW